MKSKLTKENKLSFEEMYELGNGNMEKMCCHFDFSRIDANLYNSFFHSLPNILYKKVKSVTFSCDLSSTVNAQLQQQEEEELNENENEGKNSVDIVKNSIAYKYPRYMQYLLKILRLVLLETKTIVSLELSNLEIPETHLIVLFAHIAKNKSLKSIKTRNMLITNKSFAILLHDITPYQYESLVFENANLSSLIFMEIYKFLKRKPQNDGDDRRLSIFDVSGSHFTDKEFNKITQLVNRYKPVEVIPENLSESSSSSSKAVQNSNSKNSNSKSNNSKKLNNDHEESDNSSPPPQPMKLACLSDGSDDEESGKKTKKVVDSNTDKSSRKLFILCKNDPNTTGMDESTFSDEFTEEEEKEEEEEQQQQQNTYKNHLDDSLSDQELGEA